MTRIATETTMRRARTSWLRSARRRCGAAALVALALATAAAAAPSDPSTANTGDAHVAQSRRRFASHAVVLLLVSGGVVLGILAARRGWQLPIREIPGLTVFEEAVARSTEMGRPVLFTTGGTCEIRRVQLFASMPLLREVARLSAAYGNRLIVPVCFPEALPMHTHAARDGYLAADALETFRPDDVRYFPGLQFFFAMAAVGWMLQEKPAACFYFGYWEADSLMFAETGQTVGALQVAGTDALPQVPFFVASCDYTIIGEEFWAASARISQDPQLRGSLGAQDLFKLALIALVGGGALLCLHPAAAAWLDTLRKTFA
jgi:hypothetical protein